ncbi:MAG: Zn-ribbon domain-containing OB-fold protein [Betaproteobacteria bacterium]|nr:Zn-ribbon domain-containing OB-fold protein [Betaproteobacteria bacterium]
MSESSSKPLNDTFGVKREVRRYGFSRPFWEGTREKKLLIQYCRKTGKYQHYPRPTSIFTGRRRDLEWREVSGKGEVFSYTIARRGMPAFHGHEPYVVACVTLDVGVNVIANMVHCAADEVRIGMKVAPFWLPLADGTHLLMFEPERSVK